MILARSSGDVKALLPSLSWFQQQEALTLESVDIITLKYTSVFNNDSFNSEIYRSQEVLNSERPQLKRESNGVT